jgi:hypothetical protein
MFCLVRRLVVVLFLLIISSYFLSPNSFLIVFIVGLTPMGKAVPCTFALLPNKTKTAYLCLAECVKEKLSSLPNVEMSMMIMDFEAVLVNAFQEEKLTNHNLSNKHNLWKRDCISRIVEISFGC